MKWIRVVVATRVVRDGSGQASRCWWGSWRGDESSGEEVELGERSGRERR
jgi:hypothetical protein